MRDCFCFLSDFQIKRLLYLGAAYCFISNLNLIIIKKFLMAH